MKKMKRHILIVFVFFACSLIGAQVVFCQLERGRAVSQDALPDELQYVEVKDYYIGSDVGAVGTIQTVAGHVVVAHLEEREAYFAAPGDEVFEGDVLYTLGISRCRVLFSDRNLITLGENTRIVLEEIIDDREAGEKKSALSMLRGKVMCYVMRLFRYKRISFSVSTPTAVTGVRGTKFGVEVMTEEPVSDLPYLEAAISGGTEITLVHCFEGKVEVYSPVDETIQGVEGGESLELSALGAGIVEPTTPEAAERFISGTETLPVTGGDAQSGDGSAVTDEEFGNDTGASGLGFQVDIIDTVQTHVTKVIEDANRRPTGHYGYFVGMLTKGGTVFDGTYRSQDIRNFDSNDISASYYNGDWRYMHTDSFADYSDPQITQMETPDGEYITGLPVSLQHTELGYNAYMEWGYWTQPIVMSDGTNDYDFENRGYYVLGDYTTESQMSGLVANNISGTYSGDAYGTYWTSEGGENMSGDFSTHVNFAAGTLSDFTLSVSGDEHSASVSGGTGLFTGSSSQFEINTGDWQIDGSPGTGVASGSVYGANGEAIGGSWEINNGDDHVIGMFEGTR